MDQESMKRWDQRELHLKEILEPTVTFETKCWEKGWKLILGTDYKTLDLGLESDSRLKE